ncbi:MAG: hypothetical protein NWF14_09730, partial [Candidatus Bathyarchaeota archaeon]|nr:hypothetical protein [Candidatus Bathyarchaeota archaeon]
AIVFGFHAQEEWGRILGAQHDGVPVYSNRYTLEGIIPDTILREQNVTNYITRLFIDAPLDEDDYGDIYSLLPLIVTAALVDAVNPCEFYVLVVFLSIVFYRIGRKAVLKSGVAYAIAIFTVYYLMGFGLLRLLRDAQQLKVFFVAVFGFIGLVMGFREILGFLLKREFKRVPDFLSKKLSVDLRKVSEKPVTAFAVGMISGVFLLPCTSGPYFIALGLIADLERMLEGLILLTIYNGIIIAPFIAITLGLYTLRLRTGELKRWSAQRQKWVNLASGLAITFLSLYLLSTIIL